MAVCAPERPALGGLQVAAQGADEGRAEVFCGDGVRGRRTLCHIAAMADGVALAAIVQSVARVLRRDGLRRARHGQRFLEELAELWADVRAGL